MEILMKTLLENYDVFYFLGAMTLVSFLMKIIGAAMYKKLIRDSSQMGTTKNKWMKAMMAKFEAYYKLQISVHNVENFVDRYLYHYHFLGLPLQTWECIGFYTTAATIGFASLFSLAAGYYKLPQEWFLVMGFVVVALLFLQGVTEWMLNGRQYRKLFRVQLIDYMENTMRARLENEYFHQEAAKQYQMEYFQEAETQELQETDVVKGREEKESKMQPQKDNKKQSVTEGVAWNGREVKELLASLLEEVQLNQELYKKQQALTGSSEAERAQLFEEVLKEYM